MIEFADEEGIVSTVDDEAHELNDGDFVFIAEVRGKPLESKFVPVQIEVISRSSLLIIPSPCSTNFVLDRKRFRIPIEEAKKLAEGGKIVQVKQHKEVHFKPLNKAMLSPEFTIWDYAKIDWAIQLHHLWQALHLFEKDVGYLSSLTSSISLVAIVEFRRVDHQHATVRIFESS